MRWMLIVLVVWCGSSVSQAAPATVIPLEDFTRSEEFGDSKISPDGKHLAFTTGKNGRERLVCAGLRDTMSAGAIKMAGNYEISEFHWVSPTHLVYFTNRTLFGEVQPRPSAEMFSVDNRCQTPRKIYGFHDQSRTTGTRLPERAEADEATPRFLSALPSNPDTVLVAEHAWRKRADLVYYNDPDAIPRMLLLNVKTGERQSLGRVPLEGARVLLDRNAAVRFAVGRTDSATKLLWRPRADAPWNALDVPEIVADTVEPRAFSADGTQILLTAVPRGASHVALHRLDPVQKKVTLVHAFEGLDVDTVLQDVAANGGIAGVMSSADQPQHHWLKDTDATVRLYQALQRAFPGQSIAITSATADGGLAIVLVRSDVDPGSYFLFDARQMRADFMRAARAWIDPAKMLPKRAVELAARDGLKLRGYVTVPTGKGPFPMVVVPHDGPQARDTLAFDPIVQLLANRGYAVLQVNYRGSSGYGLQFAAAGNGEWGARMQDDVTDATRWAIDQGIARQERICIFGKGYGAYAALTGAIREPKLYRCAIGLGGYYDLELLAQESDFSFDERRFVKQVLGDDRTVLQARSPVYNAQRIEAPVLLIHGEQDFVAGYEHARRMRSALQRSGKSFDLLTLEDESHDVYDERTRRDVYERIVRFLAKHLQE